MGSKGIPLPMSNDETLNLDHFVCFAVYSANHAFNRVYKPILDRLGVTYPQFIVLVTLWSEDALTVGQIGERVMLETNTLTPLLKRLENAGMVRRVRDSADERQVRIFLTDKGRALRAEAESVPSEISACLGRDADSIAELTGELTRLRNTLLARVRP